jgi:hypothetical protein
MNFKWRNPATGAAGTCTGEQKAAMIKDPVLQGLEYTLLVEPTPAQKPAIIPPEVDSPKEPETPKTGPKKPKFIHEAEPGLSQED